MKGYISYFKLRCLTNLQYRTQAIAGLFTQLFFGIVFVMVFLAFYESNQTIDKPMELSHLVSYIWLQQAFYTLIYPYEKDQELFNIIKNGNIAYELVRPQSFYIKWFIKIYSKKVINALLRFLPVIIVSLFLPEPYNLIFPPTLNNFLLFIIALFLASILITSLLMIIYIITIFTLDFKGILSIYGVIMEIFMGSIIPLPFFPNWLLNITYKLPFRYISDFPFRVYTGSINVIDGIKMCSLSFIWTIIIVIIGYLLSKVALKKAVIQGG